MKYVLTVAITCLMFCSAAFGTVTRKNIDRWTGGWIAFDANSVLTLENGIWISHLPDIGAILTTTGGGGTTQGTSAKSTITQTTDVTLSDANDGQTFYITAGDVNFTFPDACTAMLYKTYHFVNASTTTGKIMLHWDANTTPYNAVDCCSLGAGGDYAIYPDGAANVLFHKTNKSMFTYCGDGNEI